MSFCVNDIIRQLFEDPVYFSLTLVLYSHSYKYDINLTMDNT